MGSDSEGVRWSESFARGLWPSGWLVASVLAVGLASGCAVSSEASRRRPLPDQNPPPSGSDRTALAQALGALGQEPPDIRAARSSLGRLRRDPDSSSRELAGVLLQLLDARVVRDHALLVREAELADLRRRLEATERALADTQELREQQRVDEGKLRDECARTRRKLDEVKQDAQRRLDELQSLRRELDALKRIDMQRSP